MSSGDHRLVLGDVMNMCHDYYHLLINVTIITSCTHVSISNTSAKYMTRYTFCTWPKVTTQGEKWKASAHVRGHNSLFVRLSVTTLAATYMDYIMSKVR